MNSNPFFRHLITGVVATFTTVAAHANLLTNPGAEAGSIAGWTADGTSGPGVDDGSFDSGIDPRSGGFDFLGGVGLAGTLSQTVSIAGMPNAQMATISFWEQGLNQGTPSDDGFVSLTFLNSTGGVLGTVSSDVVDSHDLTWQQYTGSFIIPAGTTSIAYTMNFARNAGSDLDAFLDDNNLTVGAVPEPGALSMLGLGMGLVAWTVRRRRTRVA